MPLFDNSCSHTSLSTIVAPPPSAVNHTNQPPRHVRKAPSSSFVCPLLQNGPNGSWLGNPAWSPAEKALFLGGETAMWGEGINEDNFDAFVWRGAAAAAERLWSTEESLGCPESACPGITGARKRSYWLHEGDPRFADQLCRMSQQGIKTGPIAPGFCPSDATSGNTDRLLRLEQEAQALARENGRLRAQLARFRGPPP